MKRISAYLSLVLLLAVAACSGDPATQPDLEDFAAAGGDASYLVTPTDIGDADAAEVEGDEYSGEDGPFEVLMAGAKVDLVFRFNGKVRAKEEVSITLRAVAKNGDEAVKGSVKVNFGDGSEETYEIRREVDFTHIYRQAGTYKISAVLTTEDNAKARGNLRVRVSDPLRVEMEMHGLEELRPKEETELQLFVYDAEQDRNDGVPGELTIDLGGNDQRLFKNFTGVVTFDVTYDKVGQYSITVTLLTEAGREFIQTFEFEVEDGPANGDAIDLSRAIIASNSARDIANFKVTSQVTNVSVSPGQICIFHTKQTGWPRYSSVDGNAWVAAMYQGQLHAGTYEWVAYPALCKGLGAAPPNRTVADMLGPHIKNGPFANWKPKKGDTVYFFTSTHARLGLRTIDERSNVVAITWPF